MYEQMAKSYEAELARRRKEISFGESKYQEDTTKFKSEIKRLRERVSAQRMQITGISNDLAIYRQALISFESSREKDHETLKEYRQSMIMQKRDYENNFNVAKEDTEPEIEPAEPDENQLPAAESTLPLDSGDRSPAYLDMLATLMSTQAALDRTEKQCDRQARLLRELRHAPGSEQEILLQEKVRTLEEQLEAAQSATVGASPFAVPFKGSTYQLSRFAPRTMRGQEEPSRQSSVPSLPQV
jgi:chromosome segregation ATPase